MSDHVGEDDGWASRLRALIDAEPLVPSLAEAVRPMGGMRFLDADGAERALDIAQVHGVIASARVAIRGVLQAEGCPEFGEDAALAIRLYTIERPFRLYRLVNGQMHAPERDAGPGGVSEGLRKCLPYIKYLCEAMENAPAKFVYSERCHRGVKWAFPRCGELPDGSWADEHDPAAYFFPGREFPWYEFKSASFSFDTMYLDCFCGDRGPRTIFSIEGVRGIKVRKRPNLARRAKPALSP